MSKRSGAGRRVKPSGGFELMTWYWMRISGVLLAFLAVGHLVITHIINNVESINYAFIASRWATPRTGFFWRFWDLAMLSLAVFHGFNGLRQVLDEYVIRPGRRIIVHTLIWSCMFALLAIGSYAILMFEKDEKYINQWEADHGRVVDASPSMASAPSPLATTSR